MSRKMPILRVAGPTMLVSLLLFGACTATAVFLYRWHAASAEQLTGDIDSRKLAGDMEVRLAKLISQLRSGKFENVRASWEQLQEDFAQAEELANTEKEAEVVKELKEGLNHFWEVWESREERVGEDRKKATKDAIQILDTQARRQAIKLHENNSAEIEESEKFLRRTVKWIAWGLLAVGSIGSLGGILLGYSVARALRQSIYQLSVRIRDAADRLGQDLPTVTIRQADGIEYLNEQMQHLVRDIDHVVERLHQREREVLRAEQLAAVGQLAAGVAHELRNPLTAVKMLVQTSREELEAKGLSSEDLQIIEHEIRRLERSLQTFLDFARPPKMERRMIDLGAVIEQAFALVTGRVRKQKVELHFEPPDPPIHLEADPDQLRQLLINLAMNALDAMPHGGHLTVSVTQVGTTRLDIKITDTGAGIPRDIMPRLFEPFASGKETGLGLGLVVSRRIAEAHEGVLHAENLPQGGACFTVRLPALLRHSSEPEVPARA